MAGLHLNGEIANWQYLKDEWLKHHAAAIANLKPPTQTENPSVLPCHCGEVFTDRTELATHQEGCTPKPKKTITDALKEAKVREEELDA